MDTAGRGRALVECCRVIVQRPVRWISCGCCVRRCTSQRYRYRCVCAWRVERTEERNARNWRARERQQRPETPFSHLRACAAQSRLRGKGPSSGPWTNAIDDNRSVAQAQAARRNPELVFGCRLGWAIHLLLPYPAKKNPHVLSTQRARNSLCPSYLQACAGRTNTP
jgi:hypothetical protein